jgi:hypothetical protein
MTAQRSPQLRREGDRFRLALHRIWRPSPQSPLDLETTVEAYLPRTARDATSRRDSVRSVSDAPLDYDTAQAGLPIVEFPQTVANTMRMGQVLFDALNGRNLLLYPSAELREQALSTVAVGNARGWRIAKEKTSKKIDAIVVPLWMVVCGVVCFFCVIVRRIDARRISIF